MMWSAVLDGDLKRGSGVSPSKQSLMGTSLMPTAWSVTTSIVSIHFGSKVHRNTSSIVSPHTERLR
eukprot:7611776-Pyramimonas_sp.AAC.1